MGALTTESLVIYNFPKRLPFFALKNNGGRTQDFSKSTRPNNRGDHH